MVSFSSTASYFKVLLTSNKEQFSEQNRRALKEVAMGSEQYEISNRAGATVATVTLKAFRIVTKSKSKLKRKQSKCKKKKQTAIKLLI